MPTNPTVISTRNLDGTNGFRINGIDPFDYSGVSVSDAGDVNGDGFDDILIGASRAESGSALTRGETYVVFGKSEGFSAALELDALNGTNGFRVNGLSEYDNSGYSVSSAGDINNDGFADILIGAPFAQPDGIFPRYQYSGESYVVFGKASAFRANVNLVALDGTTGFRMIGADGTYQTGFSVPSAGDINGDGFSDILVGAPSSDRGRLVDAGATYVLFGKAQGFDPVIDLTKLNGLNGFRIAGSDEYGRSGRSVSSAGDINGDGLDDILVGSPFATNGNGESYAGESYVLFGKTTRYASVEYLHLLTDAKGFRLNGADEFAFSGLSVSDAGDVNGDGFDDILIGAPSGSVTDGAFGGATYVVFGKASGFGSSLDLSSLDGTNGFGIQGFRIYGGSGGSVSSAGDVNGDGFDDILIGGLVRDLDRGTVSGEAFVVFGKASGFGAMLELSTLDGLNGYRVTGFVSDDRGPSVSSVGDVNSDGFADIIIGAPGRIPYPVVVDYPGASYVIFGSRSKSDVTITGTNQGLTHNGGYGADTINALGGDDIVRGWENSDTIDGGRGNDDLDGGSGADTLRGGIGNDTLDGGIGTDTLEGGAGNDRYFIDRNDTLFENADAGIDTVFSATSFTLGDNFENLTLTGTARVQGTGNALNNTLTGNAANNVLNGAAGSDALIGNAGADLLTGGTQSDRFKFAFGDTGQDAATMDRITDFEKGALGVGDRFDFSSAIRFGGSAAAATATEASIHQRTGVATFAAGSGRDMVDAVNDIANRLTQSGDAVGEFALFQLQDTGAYHVFVSDGVAGVTENDLLVRLTNIISIGSISLSGGDLMILA